MSVIDLLDAYRRRERSPVEVVRETLQRADTVDVRLHAFVMLTPDLALEQAAAAERAYADGTAGPLAGVPMTIKDLLDVSGVPTSAGSLLGAARMADADAPLVAIVRAAGAAIIGKSATPESGWKGETTSRVHGSTENPWRAGLTSGGSSGGAAAAAAMLPDVLHHGGDGAGSIRIPSSMCGVFGLKPTWGLVPTDAVNSGLSVQGPITRHVAESALLMDVLTGGDALAGLGEGVQGLRVAWSRDLGFAAAEPVVVAVCEAAARSFAALGAVVEEAHPRLADPWPIVDAIWCANQAAPFVDGRLAEVRDLLDPGRLPVIERGLAMAATELLAAHAGKARYAEGWDAFMRDHDLLLTPTLPVTAFEAGLDQPGSVAGRATEYLSWTAFTYPFNVSGQPAATVPCGSVDGLPVGLQIVGRRGADALVLRAAAAFEAAHPWRFPQG
ncbi:MAG: aspartyl-tRNA(Asn)/glutamyl-tRNA(Gln) amidotransferase subunit [Gaiellales bacterium]|nr:aspartyl-tRNA(Asn)/glutamyl-tRNA(Gln) amidotransferase subunit [Gaiellales bacterium]